MVDTITVTKHVEAGDYLTIMSVSGQVKCRVVAGTVDKYGNIITIRDLTRWERFKLFLRHPIREIKMWRTK